MKKYRSYCVELYSDIDCKRAIKDSHLSTGAWAGIYRSEPHDGGYVFLSTGGYAMITYPCGEGVIDADSERGAQRELSKHMHSASFLTFANNLTDLKDSQKVESNGIILRSNRGGKIHPPIDFAAVLWTGNNATFGKDYDIWLEDYVMRVDDFSDYEVTTALEEIFMCILAQQIYTKSLESHK